MAVCFCQISPRDVPMWHEWRETWFVVFFSWAGKFREKKQVKLSKSETNMTKTMTMTDLLNPVYERWCLPVFLKIIWKLNWGKTPQWVPHLECFFVRFHSKLPIFFASVSIRWCFHLFQFSALFVEDDAYNGLLPAFFFSDGRLYFSQIDLPTEPYCW